MGISLQRPDWREQLAAAMALPDYAGWLRDGDTLQVVRKGDCIPLPARPAGPLVEEPRSDGHCV